MVEDVSKLRLTKSSYKYLSQVRLNCCKYDVSTINVRRSVLVVHVWVCMCVWIRIRLFSTPKKKQTSVLECLR